MFIRSFPGHFINEQEKNWKYNESISKWGIIMKIILKRPNDTGENTWQSDLQFAMEIHMQFKDAVSEIIFFLKRDVLQIQYTVLSVYEQSAQLKE